MLSVEGLSQGAKIRKDKTSGYVVTSTMWGRIGGADVNVVGLVKLSADLTTEWSRSYGQAGGDSQVGILL